MSYQTSSKRSPSFWLLIGQKNAKVFWHQSEARTAVTVWNWSGKTLSPWALLAVLYFSSCHIFPPVWTFLRPHYLPLGLKGCSKIVRHKVFCDLLDRKLVNLHYKNIDFKKRKLAFFQKGYSMVFGQKLEILFLFSFSVK